MHSICFPIDQARIHIKDGKFKICWPQGKNFAAVWKIKINDANQIHIFWTFPEKVPTSLIFK